MRDTIDMAREAWISEAEAEMLRDFEECYLSCTYLADLKAFEALVRADERDELYKIAMFAPFDKDADLLMPESEVDENEADDFFKSSEFRSAMNNTVKATTFTICSAIRSRGETK